MNGWEILNVVNLVLIIVKVDMFIFNMDYFWFVVKIWKDLQEKSVEVGLVVDVVQEIKRILFISEVFRIFKILFWVWKLFVLVFFVGVLF